MIKFISLILDLNNDYIFVFHGQKMNKYDNRIILELSNNGNIYIDIYQTNCIISDNFLGKWIKVTMFHLKKLIFIKHKLLKYDPIKSLYDALNKDEIKNMSIFFNGKKLDKNDTNSIASLGINDDFECIIE